MVANFQKSLKRDRSLFTVFRRDFNYHNWILGFTAMCGAQGVSDVLDSSHSLQMGTEEYNLFVLQNQFFYSVFIQVLKTARGEEIVKDHEKGGVFRAQKVYRDLVAYRPCVTLIKAQKSKTGAGAKKQFFYHGQS